jgi:hypothetical protein
MNAKEAAQATTHFKPKQAIPYHFGDIIGDEDDAAQFAAAADSKVTVLKPGQTLNLNAD